MIRSAFSSAALLAFALAMSAPGMAADQSGSSPQGGTPYGFDQGSAKWKGDNGTPPGWSQGNKQGWNCPDNQNRENCKPPGLQKKQ